TINYGTVGGATGYELDASSTNFNGTGVIMSSITAVNGLGSLTVQVLNPDTTYFLKVGSLWNGATIYSATQPSTSTLTNFLSPSVLNVSSFSVTVGWPAFAVGSGTNTAQGYRLEAYSDSGYTSLVGSSQTTAVNQSTLTVVGLTAYTTYYLRAGGDNWNGTTNYITIGSTLTNAGAAPTAVTLNAVYITSITINYGTVGGATGYELDASSTNFNGTGVILSSITAVNGLGSLTVQALNPDTTYFLKVGSLWSGATIYSGTQPSTSTLTNFLSPSVLSVSSFSVTAGWPAFAVGSGTNTAQGYRLEAYNDAAYTSLAGPSQTTVVTQSTLTIGGLTAYTTYYLRAGADNWNGTTNYITIGSTLTNAGGAPTAVTLNAGDITSITINYGTVGGATGYELDASSTNFNGTGVIMSSITAVNGLGSLTVQALNPDTTYFLKVGSLWSGATIYSATQPSTSTLTNFLNPSVLSVSSFSVTAGWPAFAVGSGTNTAQGYRLEAYNDAGYTSLAGSSDTTVVTQSTLTIGG